MVKIILTLQLLLKLREELNNFLKDPLGFYSMNAFPMRSLMQQIKNYKQEEYKFEGQLKEQQIAQVERKSQEISVLEKRIPFVQPTCLLELFQEIFQSQHYYILYLKFKDQIIKFNEQNSKSLEEENEIINEDLQKQKQKKKDLKLKGESQQDIHRMIVEIEKLKRKLEQNLKEIERQNIDIQLFWKEMISIMLNGQKQKLQINPIETLAKIVKKGEPFQFLDNDDSQVDQKFLLEFIKYYKNEKALVFGILGPQNSGKSTILNKIFGCQFQTSLRRGTKGIQLQLIKITQQSYLYEKFDYALILDSQGVQNPNSNDPQIDQKLALFILAISDIILLNVKGDIHSQFKNFVEMLLYTFGQTKCSISKIKQICWCFNQNNDTCNFAPFLYQIQHITNTLYQEINKYDGDENSQTFDYNDILDINRRSIKILGFASTQQRWRGFDEQWSETIVNETFSYEAQNFGVQIINQYFEKYQSQKDCQLLNLFQFIQNIKNIWKSICGLTDFSEFDDLLGYKQDSIMKQKYENLLENQTFDYQTQIPSKIQNHVLNQKWKNLEFFEKLVQDEQRFIQFEKEIIKNKIEEELQRFKQENNIQKKIYQKYIRILEESLSAYESNCQLVLAVEIKKHKSEFQQKK